MKQQSYPMFDASQVPGDLCPIATKMNPMLPGDWRSMKPVVDRAKWPQRADGPKLCFERHLRRLQNGITHLLNLFVHGAPPARRVPQDRSV